MAGWTKAQFDANYSFRCERYLPSVIQTGRPEVRLNYYSHFMRPILANRWDNIVSNILDITSSDKVVVMGAAFGWGVDRLIELTGCEAVGLDISDYVDSVKTINENADLIAAIQFVGLNETVGRGLEIFNFYSTSGARSTATIFKEDLLTPASRQRVKTGMNNFDPTWIVTEDMFQDLTVQQGNKLVTALDSMTATKVHIIGRETPRTAEEINVFTGHKVIVAGSYKVVG